MIIKFDRTPEEYYRLSRTALEEGALDRALLYGEKALRGKGSTEYKVSLAEIFLSMGRHYDAINLAFDALCHGRGMRSEIYEILIHAMNESGHVFESIYYFTRKARLEGDSDAIDTMDEMMTDFVKEKVDSASDGLFVVGEKKPRKHDFAHTAFLLHRGKFDEAIASLAEVEADSPQYREALEMMLKTQIKAGKEDDALCTAEELVRLDPKCAYALFVLISQGGKREYLPLLEGVEDDKQDLYFAIAAADGAGEYALSRTLADRLLRAEPYLPEAFFVSAAAYLNGGDKSGSAEILRRLFDLYSRYPAGVLLKGWSRLKKCSVLFSGEMPKEAETILRRYIRKNAETSEVFVRSLLTDEDFRLATVLLFEEGDAEVCENLAYFLGVECNKQVDAFFTKMLLNVRVEPVVKRAILSQLLLHKDKGKLWVAATGVPSNISCEKPPHYPLYPESLKIAYLKLYSASSTICEGECNARINVLTERLYFCVGVERNRADVYVAAILCRLFEEGRLDPFTNEEDPEQAALNLVEELVGTQRVKLAELRKYLPYLEGDE